jgi:L-amino acid N-acyltransferase YncA
MAVDTEAITIEALRPEHWEGVALVYAEGIETGNATFETEVPAWERLDGSHLPEHRLVALRGGEVVGWAAVGSVSDRCVYGGVVEHSVYVGEAARGQGVGDPVTRVHVERAAEALQDEFAGTFSRETIARYIAESVDLLGESKVKDASMSVRREAIRPTRSTRQ